MIAWSQRVRLASLSFRAAPITPPHYLHGPTLIPVFPFVTVSVPQDHFADLQSNLQGHDTIKHVGE
jgi:hypothetical protein